MGTLGALDSHREEKMYLGSTFVRRQLAYAFARIKGPGTSPFDYAARRWGENSEVLAAMTRSGVPAAGTGADDLLSEHVQPADARVFIELLQRVTLFDRLEGMVRMSPKASYLPSDTQPAAHWVGESKAIPATAMTTRKDRLRRKKVGSIILFTDELIEDESTESEIFVRDRLVDAIRLTLDLAFLDPLNGGTSATPASVLYGCPNLTSSGDPAEDVAALIGSFSGSLRRAVFITHPQVAAQIGLRAANGVGAACGALGGTLAGLPIFTSDAAEFDSDGGTLALIDAGGIAATDEGVSIQTTKDALIELDSAPTGAADTPTAASATLSSLYQSDMTAWKLVRYANWQRISETAAVTMSGCSYPVAS